MLIYVIIASMFCQFLALAFIFISYKNIRARSLLFFAMGIFSMLLTSLFILLGNSYYSHDINLTKIFFRTAFVFATISLIFAMLFVELLYRPYPSPLFFSYLSLGSFTIANKVFICDIELFTIDGYVFGVSILLFCGVNIDSLLTTLLSTWLGLNLLYFTIKQWKRIKSSEKRKWGQIFALGAFLLFGGIAISRLLRAFNLVSLQICENITVLCAGIGGITMTLAYLAYPQLSLLLLHHIYGFVIMSLSGLPITSMSIEKNIRPYIPLITGLLSGMRALGITVLAAGPPQIIDLGKVKIIACFGANVCAFLLVDRVLNTHRDLLVQLVKKLDYIKVPVVIDSEFSHKIKKEVFKFIDPFLP